MNARETWTVACQRRRPSDSSAYRLLCVFLTSSTLSTAALAQHPAHVSDPSLLGCWRSEKGVAYFSDGTSREGKGKCATEISEDRIVLECVGRPDRIVYSYYIPSPGVYIAEVIEHKAFPELVGRKRRAEYQIDGNTLTITTYPMTDIAGPHTIKLKSSASKVPGAKVCDPN